MPLHTDLEAFLELVSVNGSASMWEMSPSDARDAYDRSTEMLDAPGARVPVEEPHYVCRDGHAAATRLYRPGVSCDPRPILLFFHGGGYVVGGLDSHDSLCRDLAYYSDCAVLSVDYRLAPEHRFPTAFDDATDALDWLHHHGAEYQLDTSRIAIGGDSAGGALATALCIQAKAHRRPQPLLQLLLYPCTSANQDFESHRRFATGYLLEQKTLQWMFDHYLRTPSDPTDWRFAPLGAEDLSGLAPAHIALAEFDPLVDEGLAYAARLRAAGVLTTVKVHEGMIHDFARLGNVMDDVRTFRQELGRVLNDAFKAIP